MAKKKVTKKKVSKKKVSKKQATTAKVRSTKIGRPDGSKTYIPVGLEVRLAAPLSRANAIDRLKGVRRAILEVAPNNEVDGLRLEALVNMLQSQDASLFRLMDKSVKSLS